MAMMTPTELHAALAMRGAHAEPIIPAGWRVPNGYTLYGPRGNRCVVGVDANGNIDDFGVNLWLDGIAYGDAKALAR